MARNEDMLSGGELLGFFSGGVIMPHISDVVGPVTGLEFRRAMLLGRAAAPDLPFFRVDLSVWKEIDTDLVFVAVEVQPQSGQTAGVEFGATARVVPHGVSAGP